MPRQYKALRVYSRGNQFSTNSQSQPVTDLYGAFIGVLRVDFKRGSVHGLKYSDLGVKMPSEPYEKHKCDQATDLCDEIMTIYLSLVGPISLISRLMIDMNVSQGRLTAGRAEKELFSATGVS